MSYTRRLTNLDATWARAWTADTPADLVSISAIIGSERPHRGDIAYVTSTSSYYLWMDDGSWFELTAGGLSGGPNGGNVFHIEENYHEEHFTIPSSSGGGGGDVTQAGTNAFTGANSFANNPIDLLSGQIKFPATQNASAVANILDDYEEGTWTPVDASGAGLTFGGSSKGTYTKVGSMVFCWFNLAYPVTANGLSQKVGGLPFTSKNIDLGAGFFSYIASGITTTIYVNQNATDFVMYSYSGAGFTNANFSNLIFWGALTYQAAA